MKRNSRHGVHVRLGNVLDNDGNIELPCTDRLVVRSRDESAVVVDEGDSIDRSKMLVVLLRDIARVHVVLCEREPPKLDQLPTIIPG